VGEHRDQHEVAFRIASFGGVICFHAEQIGFFL
jgi:hypothetical protein